MGRYFNPANEDAIRASGGRRLTSTGKGYAELTAQLQPGETVAMLGDRGVFKFCSDLYSEAEYQEFAQQERTLVGYSYWAIRKRFVQMTIDTRKTVKFYDDRSKVKDYLTLTKILFQNDNVCLCLVEGEAWANNLGEVLFKLDGGEVLSNNLSFWYATDKTPPE